jgi:hypothetical protein
MIMLLSVPLGMHMISVWYGVDDRSKLLIAGDISLSLPLMPLMLPVFAFMIPEVPMQLPFIETLLTVPVPE